MNRSTIITYGLWVLMIVVGIWMLVTFSDGRTGLDRALDTGADVSQSGGAPLMDGPHE